MSQYGHLLPTQTYIAQNNPQYVSVFDNQTAGGGSVLRSPVNIKSSEDTHQVGLTVDNASADFTITAVGNINLVSEAEGILLSYL